MSGRSKPASSISMTSSIEPTFSAKVGSDMLESPTITCMRRKRWESPCGSSRVLMIGRVRVVADETPSHTWSARWEMTNLSPAILPAPQISWRVIRNGSSCWPKDLSASSRLIR